VSCFIPTHLLDRELTNNPNQAHPFALRKRDARIKDEDEDVSSTNKNRALIILKLRSKRTTRADDELDATLAVIPRRAALTTDDDDDVSPTLDDDGQLIWLSIRANPTHGTGSIRARATHGTESIPEDDDDVPPTCDADGQLAVSPTSLRKRAARVDDDDDDISPTSGGDCEIMAAPVRRGRGNKSVASDLDDSMGAKYKEGEVRLRQALAKLQEMEERLKQSELELMLCEADERSLGVLLSESTESSRQQGPHPACPASEALRVERLLRARQHLGAEQARRQMASAVAKARLKTSNPQP